MKVTYEEKVQFNYKVICGSSVLIPPPHTPGSFARPIGYNATQFLLDIMMNNFQVLFKIKGKEMFGRRNISFY